jgi:hexosaminidase
LCEVLAALKSMGATGVLLEWEDVFPYSGTLQCLGRAEACYSPDEVRRVLEAALALGLEVIPLVQTVGHLEFALKHDTFAALREDPDDYGTLCPVLQDSHVFIKELINQVAQLHLHSTRMHIGCDEPTLGISAQTSAAAAADVDGLAGVLAEHVCSTCAALSDVGAGRSLRALMWHDAAVSMPEGCLARLLSSGVRCVCWDYTSLDYPDRPAVAFAERLQRRGAAPYIATAYKGGDASDAAIPATRTRGDASDKDARAGVDTSN